MKIHHFVSKIGANLQFFNRSSLIFIMYFYCIPNFKIFVLYTFFKTFCFVFKCLLDKPTLFLANKNSNVSNLICFTRKILGTLKTVKKLGVQLKQIMKKEVYIQKFYDSHHFKFKIL